MASTGSADGLAVHTTPIPMNSPIVVTIRSVEPMGLEGGRWMIGAGSLSLTAAAYCSRVAALSLAVIFAPSAVKSTRQPQVSRRTRSTTTLPMNWFPR